VILNLAAPTSKKEVQAFMHIINFAYRFVPDFAFMVKPIHNLLKQDRSCFWIDDIENDFLRIKSELNEMGDRLIVFATSPNRNFLPQGSDCTFQSLYRPHIPDNVES
jgi:hypothetical protein